MPGDPTAPLQRYRLLRKVLPRRLQPWARGARRALKARVLAIDEPYRTVYPYTQVSGARQRHIVELCGILERSRVAGAVVECGVLDGGMAALMAHATRRSGRDLHLFDAWQGLPEAVDRDGVESKKWSGQVVGSPIRVERIMRKMKIEPSRVHLHRGWFHETFPQAPVGRVALLHVDCDFYEPTRLCLRHWYPVLVPGGFIQLDDYGAFAGCRCAVDEFLERHSDLTLEHQDRPGGAWFLRKPLSALEARPKAWPSGF